VHDEGTQEHEKRLLQCHRFYERKANCGEKIFVGGASGRMISDLLAHSLGTLPGILFLRLLPFGSQGVEPAFDGIFRFEDAVHELLEVQQPVISIPLADVDALVAIDVRRAGRHHRVVAKGTTTNADGINAVSHRQSLNQKMTKLDP
jgi:hypothetical protein